MSETTTSTQQRISKTITDPKKTRILQFGAFTVFVAFIAVLFLFNKKSWTAVLQPWRNTLFLPYSVQTVDKKNRDVLNIRNEQAGFRRVQKRFSIDAPRARRNRYDVSSFCGRQCCIHDQWSGCAHPFAHV